MTENLWQRERETHGHTEKYILLLFFSVSLSRLQCPSEAKRRHIIVLIIIVIEVVEKAFGMRACVCVSRETTQIVTCCDFVSQNKKNERKLVFSVESMTSAVSLVI